MTRAMIVTALMLGTALGAQAGTNDTYYDMIRPNGHPRSDAIFQAALNACYSQTGASRFSADTPAFKQCMLGRSYRWTSVQTIPTRGSGSIGPDPFSFTSPAGPSPDTSPPPEPGPDTAGMNTSTNPTWPALTPGE